MKSKEFTLLVIRLALGLIYFTAGFSKLSPDYLGNIIGPVDMGKFYESTAIGMLMTVVAVYQIVAGALLLSQRYSVAGLILTFPLSVGTLIFTIVAGFAGTPFINLFLLLLLIYAMLDEKNAIKEVLKRNFLLTPSNVVRYFPNKQLPNIALVLTGLIGCLTFLDAAILNVLLTVALLLFTINLFQFKNYLVLDKIILALFFIIGLVIINGILLNQIIPKAFYSVFALIPLGFLFYLIRLIYWRFSKQIKE